MSCRLHTKMSYAIQSPEGRECFFVVSITALLVVALQTFILVVFESSARNGGEDDPRVCPFSSYHSSATQSPMLISKI